MALKITADEVTFSGSPLHIEFPYNQSVLVYGCACKMTHLHLYEGPGNKQRWKDRIYRNALIASAAVNGCNEV